MIYEGLNINKTGLNQRNKQDDFKTCSKINLIMYKIHLYYYYIQLLVD